MQPALNKCKHGAIAIACINGSLMLSSALRYEMIAGCWAELPDKRPSFQDLVQSVSSLLEGVAGYMDFSAFSSKAIAAEEECGAIAEEGHNLLAM